MSFRDDNDALRARVESLEGELSHTQRALAEAEERERARSAPPALALPGLFTGAPEIVLERDVPGPLEETRLEELVLALRDYTGKLGALETVGRTTEWRAQASAGGQDALVREVSLRATERDGVTRVRLRQGVHHRRKQALASLRGWGMVLVVVSVFAMIPARGGARGLLLLLLASAPGLVALQRLAFRRSMRSLRKRLAALLDAHLPAAAWPVRARVGDEEQVAVEVPATLPNVNAEQER